MTHRFRLALSAAAVSVVVLGIVFCGVILAARQAALSTRRAELVGALRALTGDQQGLELAEFEESHPDMSMVEFDAHGGIVASVGHLALPAEPTFTHSKGLVSVGAHRGRTLVVVGADWHETEDGLKRLAVILGLLCFPLALIGGVVSWLVAGAVFRPMQRLTEQAAVIGRQNLAQRLETTDKAELGEFAATMNAMLDRIQASVDREERFASDAAHELRTPLAILRVRLESTLRRDRTREEYVASQRETLAELERLSRIVDSLLRTTRALAQEPTRSALADGLGRAAARWQDRAVERGVELRLTSTDAEVALATDEVAVVLDNLLDNALRYAPSGTAIEVAATCNSSEARISVRDHGPGVDPSVANRIFDRFVRGDDDRNRSSGGAGIGLALCRRILEARGGRLELATTAGSGAEFVCFIPAS